MALQSIRQRGRAATDAIGRVAGYELIRRHFYSPIPDLNSLPQEVWTRTSDLRGLTFDANAGLTFVESELATFMAGYRPPVAPTGHSRDFHLDNGFYGALDAHTLYAMVRRFQPQTVLELGSGMSSLVIADALAEARSDSQRHTIYDPFPRDDLRSTLAAIANLRAVSAVDVPEQEVAKLRAGDLLFVDTTHTVKIGGDVNRVILDLLPTVAPGVLVHIHDIYLPWEYPREFMTERRFFWAEQYLLQAFLAFNHTFEVLFANHALWRLYPGQIRRLIGEEFAPRFPSAIWLRRCS